MKTFTKYLLLPLCCLFMAAGCGKDDLPTGEQPEGPGSETGILSFENWDLTVADDMEILPTDNAPGTSSTRSTVDAPDDYIVKIYNSKKEQVGSYTYAEIKTTGNIELPQDSYTVTAESPNYASTPDVAWETPVYYGEISVNVIKKLTTTVNNLVCKLGNIKATVGLSADLDSLFKPDDETDKLTVTLSIQDNSLVYGRPEATGETLKPGFFRAVDTDNTLKIVLSGQYNKAGEGEPASYVRSIGARRYRTSKPDNGARSTSRSCMPATATSNSRLRSKHGFTTRKSTWMSCLRSILTAKRRFPTKKFRTRTLRQ